MPRRHRRLEVTVGCGDDANVHLQRRRPADPLEALLLEGAENFCLQQQRQIARAVKNAREMALLPYTATAR